MNKNGDTATSPSAWIEVPHFAWKTLTAGGAPTVRFSKGQTLFSQGDPVNHVLVVEHGRVRLVLLSESGHEKHMAIVGTHGLVGECSAFLDGRHSVTAVASSDVVARQVERQQLLHCIERDPECLRQVLWLMNVKLRVLAHQNLLLSQATAAQRVIHHLVQLADTYGEAHAAGVAIRISFTHQEMANIAGLSRVMTSNVLTQLQDQGMIEMVKSHCVIRDPDGLRRRALAL
ncbi:Crp/Fnr family transcriptional regulator [Variovorax sp. J22R24]|uniref:Crp/Fnr family transcriptional regulator n=1 Tax=Variovorax gracilis TaxID=3053502 RepID=UPI00257694F1|nr:Crp/Fnr family transcriptional regulator [Variovorax sp. J22R24]MDM0107880.1 Crp/Fnr family transcriptional regulator [Variovorax sp. J22R24]